MIGGEVRGVPLLEDVTRAADAVESAKGALDERRADLHAAIRAAAAEGISAAAIARAAGLSRERVRRIIAAGEQPTG